MPPSDEKRVPEWIKGVGLIGAAVLSGGGGAYVTGSQQLKELDRRIGLFEVSVAERLARLETKFEMLQKSLDRKEAPR